MSERPVIGVCTALEKAKWSVWDEEAALIPRSYLTQVQRAGGLPVMLPPDEAVVEDPDAVLDLIDGLMLAGGIDIAPETYGAEPGPHTNVPAPARDRFELALTRRALERDLPLLGVCRGMQLMNIARGGTLHQHLPDAVGHDDHRRVIGSFEGADHDVRLAEGSLAARAAGETVHPTKSHHHQGIDRLGEGLAVTGWAVLDDLPEAIEVPENRYALGVQWHPEADEDSPLIASLVEEARTRRAERDGAKA